MGGRGLSAKTWGVMGNVEMEADEDIVRSVSFLGRDELAFPGFYRVLQVEASFCLAFIHID